MDRDTFLSVPSGRAGVKMKQSLSRHQQDSLGILPARLFGKGIVIGYYYGSLVYSDLFPPHNTSLACSEQLMEITRETIRIEWLT